MVTILDATLGLNGLRAAIVLLAITAGYSMLSGLWGVVMTDLFQFIFAMGGSIVLAVVAVRATGGLDRLVELTAAHFGSHGAAFGILPPLDSPWLPLSSLLVFLAGQWWAAWYPRAETWGGGYVAQRDCEQPGAGARVARGDRLADGARHRGDVRPLLRRAGLALPAGARRWHRLGADPALVLVADQRLERACRDGRFVRHVPRLVEMDAPGGRRPHGQGLRDRDARDRRRHHGRLDRRDVPDRPRAG